MLRRLGKFAVVMSVAMEFFLMVFVATVFTFMMFGRLRRQRSVGSYSLALLGSHTLQTLVAYLALRHIVLNELLHFGL